MKLEYLRLENFRQYEGVQEAELSVHDELNVTVFHGLNGAGKTSLFTAVTWCLYGSGAEEIGELASKAALSRAAEGEIVHTSVTVRFRHEMSRYMAKRTVGTVRSGKSTRVAEQPEFSLTRIETSGDAHVEPNPNLIMNQVLPANVRTYFFFDGEKMDDLTRADNEEVENAVRNVMRLPAMERAQRHLEKVAQEYRSELRKGASHELEDIIAEEEKLRSERAKAVARKSELEHEIRLGRQHVADLEARLRDKAGAAELQKRRDGIQRQWRQLEAGRIEQLKGIQEGINRVYPSLLEEAATQALKVLDEKRERGEIPSGIREQFVKDLLDQMECICGRPFGEHDGAHAALQGLLERTATGELEDEVLRLAGELRMWPTLMQRQRQEINRLKSSFDANGQALLQLEKERDEIDHQLAQMPDEDIAGLERQREKLQSGVEVNIAELRSTEDRIVRIDAELAQNKTRKKAAEAQEKKLRLLARKEQLAQDAADAVARIKAEFFEYARKQIEVATKQVFARLAWKQDHFQDVNLDQDFRMEVIDRWGMPTRKELSAGERQILSLAFICAMSRVADEDAPLVMDTPFGRLSGNHLTTVAENLPNLTSQLILFVTDREWDEASRTNLEPRAGRQYELRFDDRNGCTEIVEVTR